MKFEVNNDINSNVSLCQRGITTINVDAIVNPTSQTLISGVGGPGLLHKCQK